MDVGDGDWGHQNSRTSMHLRAWRRDAEEETRGWNGFPTAVLLELASEDYEQATSETAVIEQPTDN